MPQDVDKADTSPPPNLANDIAQNPRLAYVDPQGEDQVADGDVDAFAAGRIANLVVDADRNGTLSQPDDSAEDTWTEARGAIFIANVDDDNRDGKQDAIDNVVNGQDDEADFAPILVRRASALTPEDSLSLTVAPTQAQKAIRIFEQMQDGTRRLVVSPQAPNGTLSSERLRAADIRLMLESSLGRSPTWDGKISVTLTLRRGTSVVSTDTVAMRVSPVIFPDNLQAARRVYVMRIDDAFSYPNRPFYNDLAANMPSPIQLVSINSRTYSSDRWVQDNMELGYQQWPGTTGPIDVQTYAQLERKSGLGGLESLLPKGLLAPNLGYHYPGGKTASSLNYGGNLEVAPPHQANGRNYPFGRLLVGGGEEGSITGEAFGDHMATQQRQWLDAQGAQGPSIELSSEWLVVGHIDEIFQFVPDPNSTTGRPWKLVLASPTLARRALTDLARRNLGHLKVFARRSNETTVARILADADIMSYNQAAQTRIDSVRLVLEREMQLTAADIIEVPVLYEQYTFDGMDQAVAYNPGIQNLLVAGDTMFIPDPEGPRDPALPTTAPNLGDVWRTQTTQALANLGAKIRYQDIFTSYHLLLGEVHCGTNVERASYAPWWSAQGVSP